MLNYKKLERQFGGIKDMVKMPDALLIVDTHKEKLAVKEARMKTSRLLDCVIQMLIQQLLDYPVPMNDDSISSLKLILGTIAKVLSKK